MKLKINLCKHLHFYNTISLSHQVMKNSTHTCGLHAHLNTWAKYRKYVIYAVKWSSAKTTGVSIWTGQMYQAFSQRSVAVTSETETMRLFFFCFFFWDYVSSNNDTHVSAWVCCVRNNTWVPSSDFKSCVVYYSF